MLGHPDLLGLDLLMLDYSVPIIQVFAGDFDITAYLIELALSEPIPEIGSHLGWSGRFTLADVVGRDPIELSEWARPSRWRLGQVQIKIYIAGYLLPIMRIDRYQWHEEQGQGSGSLVQCLGLPSLGERTEGEIITIPAPSGPAPNSADYIAQALIGEAFNPAWGTIQPGQSLAGINGQIFGAVVSRSPIADAARITGVNWRWLFVDNAEVIRTAGGNPSDRPIAFSRAAGGYEYTTEIDSLEQPSDYVIVTGYYDQLRPVECAAGADPPDTSRDRKARPKYQKTDELQPFSLVFQDGGSNTAQILANRKWIFYQYPDDLNWDSQLYGLIDAAVLSDINLDQPIAGADTENPCQTVTIEQWPAGRIFPDLGTAATLYTAQITLQSEKRKATYKPAGVLFPSLGSNFDLVLQFRESLTTKPVLWGREQDAGITNPNTGKPQCMEPVKPKEERKPIAERPIEQIPQKGSAKVEPPDWVPAIRRRAVVELGWFPRGLGNYLAQQIAERQVRRRNGLKIKMPLPIEWLAAGCPPLAQCYLAGDLYQIEGPNISIASNGAYLEFAASRITFGGASTYRPAELIEVDFSLFASVDSVAGGVIPPPVEPPSPYFVLYATVN
jgi:hypothetical protein